MSLLRARPTGNAGEVIDGRYRIRGFIGKGGMARVYLAEDMENGEPVAVKILDHALTKDRAARERFLREVEIAATINHPHVVKVLDAGERPDGSPFLVLEYLYGETLGELLRRDGEVEAAFALPLLRQAASALACAHRYGVIHRDVKPDNLYLMGERGAPYALKVVDFGMAKLMEGQSVSGVGHTVGTLSYIAPEQALADVVDGRADVYGLGVVMYRMLTGRIPFNVRDDALLIAHHLYVPPMEPRDIRPSIDPNVEAVILFALSKSPDNRYGTMSALLDDIDRLLGRKSGPLRAMTAARRRADVYLPTSPFSRGIAKFFEAKLEAHRAR